MPEFENLKHNRMELKDIRNIFNKKFTFYGMSISEFRFFVQLVFMLFLIAVGIQMILFFIGSEKNYILEILSISIFFPFIMKKVAKKYKPGIFFLVIKKINPLKAIFFKPYNKIISKNTNTDKPYTKLN